MSPYNNLESLTCSLALPHFFCALQMSYWVFPRAKLSRKKQQCKYVPKTQCSMLSHWKICICTACLNRLLINKVKKQKHTLCQVFNHSRLMPWFMNRCSPELCNPEFSLNLWEPGQCNWDCDLTYLLKEFNYCPFLPFCWTRGWDDQLGCKQFPCRQSWNDSRGLQAPRIFLST